MEGRMKTTKGFNQRMTHILIMSLGLVLATMVTENETATGGYLEHTLVGLYKGLSQSHMTQVKAFME